MKLDTKSKVTLSTLSLIIGEVLFWGGGILVGKELFIKYKSYFNPKNWWKGKGENKS
ncbi:transporter suffix domain-containing protein [Marinifilum sp.]|uniref:transporter suffix domain-containing protein n=1 Tax=Marinifilum sp. TaxID=2033137 RepID=UPI003BABA5EB